MIQSARDNNVTVTRVKYEQFKRFIRLNEMDISKLLDESHKFTHNTFFFFLFSSFYHNCSYIIIF